MSSITTVVPASRTAPTDGNMPLRIFHSRALSSATRVKTTVAQRINRS